MRHEIADSHHQDVNRLIDTLKSDLLQEDDVHDVRWRGAIRYAIALIQTMQSEWISREGQ